MATEAEKIAFFEKYKDWAILTQGRSSVPASITLSQAALESGYGTSRLAREANSFFGIKKPGCPKWYGEIILANDDKPNEEFRKYKTIYDSFIDHADWLECNKRYDSLFENTNYIDWSNGLQEAGYATDKTYASLLIGIIEKYGLQKYDIEGDIQMQTLPNTIIRNRKKLTAITIAIIILLVALYFVGKKIFK